MVAVHRRSARGRKKNAKNACSCAILQEGKVKLDLNRKKRSRTLGTRMRARWWLVLRSERMKVKGTFKSVTHDIGEWHVEHGARPAWNCQNWLRVCRDKMSGSKGWPRGKGGKGAGHVVSGSQIRRKKRMASGDRAYFSKGKGAHRGKRECERAPLVAREKRCGGGGVGGGCSGPTHCISQRTSRVGSHLQGVQLDIVQSDEGSRLLPEGGTQGVFGCHAMIATQKGGHLRVSDTVISFVGTQDLSTKDGTPSQQASTDHKKEQQP